ncbi:MAG: hypothetical protein IBJ18_00835 [Phycisphaerales bacterium]|nr:hypothetical protein [Phycisphaerales bacterium]
MNGTPVNPSGFAVAAAFSARTGVSLPCWGGQAGPMYSNDSSSTSQLGVAVSASVSVPPTFLGGCAANYSLPTNASGSGYAVTNSASGTSSTTSTSLVGAGFGRNVWYVGEVECEISDIQTSIEPGRGIASTLWGAEEIIAAGGTPTIEVCFSSYRTGDGFDCVIGTPSPGWPSLGATAGRVGHQVTISVTANGSTTTTTGVQISGGGITPLATGLLSGSEPLDCGTSTVSIPVPTGTPVSFSVTSRSVGVGIGGDLNGDTLVDCSDKPAFIAAMNTVASDVAYDIRADLDLDGDVDVQDLIAFIAKVPCCSFGCNPADIACDDGTPLLFNPGCANSNTGPNEGDYNAFFSAIGFFYQSSQGAAAIGSFCDIACDDGTPLCESPNCANSGVNEGDYNAFFNTFFTTCTSN